MLAPSPGLLRRAWATAWRRCMGRGAGQGAPPALPPPATPAHACSHGAWALAWASHAGPHHLNQDCAGARWLLAADGPGLALAVADGVTNGAAGDVAALALVEHWLAGPPASEDQRRAFLLAAEPAVANALRRLTNDPGAATGAACWLDAQGAGWATRVGDCQLLKAHRQPAGPVPDAPAWQVQALLPDQTYAYFHPELQPAADPAQQPARMVGSGCLGEPEWVPLALAPGELMLLASDGLHTVLAPADWAAALQRQLGAGDSAPAALQGLVDDLLQTAIAHGGEDDITVLAVMCREADPTSLKEPTP